MNYKKINEKFYEKDYWGLDRSKDKWFSKYVKAKIIGKWIKKYVSNKEILLDAGGGVGNWAWYFKEYFKKVIVSDISLKALKNIPEKDIGKVNCSVFKHNLKDDSVNCILLIDVFEHLKSKDLPKMMRDLERILSKNGRIIIFSSLHGWGYRLFYQHLFSPGKRLLKYENLEGHINRLNYEEYIKIFSKFNLEVEDYYFYSIIFQQITDSLKDNSAKIFSKIFKKEKQSRLGQTTKEDVRKQETNLLVRMPLIILSFISYLDVLFFGKWYPGNSVFFILKKKESK